MISVGPVGKELQNPHIGYDFGLPATIATFFDTVFQDQTCALSGMHLVDISSRWLSSQSNEK